MVRTYGKTDLETGRSLGTGRCLGKHEHEHSLAKSLSVHTFAPSSFVLLVVRPGAPSSVLAPSSDALCSKCKKNQKNMQGCVYVIIRRYPSPAKSNG